MSSKSFLKNTVVVGFITLISRVSGLLRDFFVAKYLGAGKFSDCFLVAFKVPNLFRSIFAEGAFNSAFVPIFSKGKTILPKLICVFVLYFIDFYTHCRSLYAIYD